MLDQKRIMDKLFELPDLFKAHMKNKAYSQAKACYDKAVTVAVFLELEEKEMHQLFGERGDRGVFIIEGLFNEEQVQRAYLECIKKGETYENKKYEPLQRNSA